MIDEPRMTCLGTIWKRRAPVRRTGTHPVMEIGRARFPALLNENVTMETPHRDRIGVCAKQLLLAEPRRENVCTVPGKNGAMIDPTDQVITSLDPNEIRLATIKPQT